MYTNPYKKINIGSIRTHRFHERDKASRPEKTCRTHRERKTSQGDIKQVGITDNITVHKQAITAMPRSSFKRPCRTKLWNLRSQCIIGIISPAHCLLLEALHSLSLL